MDDYDVLSNEQSEMLRRFQEVTNIQDEQIALATLASLNWDLPRAIETQVTNDGVTKPMELDDSQLTDGSNEIPRSTATLPETDEQYASRFMGKFSRNEMPPISRLAAGSSGIRNFRANGTSAAESSSSSRARRTPTTTSPSGSDISSHTTKSSSLAAEALQNTSSVFANNCNENDEKSGPDSDDDIFHDAASFAEMDDEDDVQLLQHDDRVPLMPSDFTSIEEAMHNFVAVFEARYGGNHPPFYSGSLQSAIREAFEAPGRPVAERRPLAVYLHNDHSIACNIFAKNVLCSDLVSSLLKGQFITWPWDMTQKENRLKLFEWMDLLNIRDMRRTLERLTNERFPLLVVIIKEKGVVQPVNVVWGCDGPEQVVDKLMDGLDQYQRIKNADAVEERGRIEREEIRQEQAREYERSLAQDRARQEKLERERNEQKAKEERRVREEQDKTRRLQELAASLPEEPSSNEKGIATVRVRFPDGNMQIRRFRLSEPLRNVTLFVESKGYSLDTYRVWTSDVPKKNVVESFDLSRSLAEIKWPIREQITVDEK